MRRSEIQGPAWHKRSRGADPLLQSLTEDIAGVRDDIDFILCGWRAAMTVSVATAHPRTS